MDDKPESEQPPACPDCGRAMEWVTYRDRDGGEKGHWSCYPCTLGEVANLVG